MIRFLVLLCISFSAFAVPKDIEVWFLSNAKVTELYKLLDRPQTVYRPLTAELQCQEMGDYCFDPQFGLYKKDDSFDTVDTAKIESNGPSIPGGRSVDRNLIDCDPNNYFDVFCGKAKPESAKSVASLDLWIDTSSSIREFDFSDKDGGCLRKSLAKAIDSSCGFNQKVNVMMFDTSIKQAGTMDQLCTNSGLNDYKRMIDWIERSDAKKLVIITDIYELHQEFFDYVASKHGTFKGDKDVFTAKDMLAMADSLAKSCK